MSCGNVPVAWLEASMSSHEEQTNSQAKSPPKRPSFSLELWTLVKVLAGLLLIGFGCWRVWVFAFGNDESLLFGYRVRTARVAEQTKLMREHNQKMRTLERTVRDVRLRADQSEELQRELTARMGEQAEKDRRGYQMERWFELLVVLLVIVVSPGLVSSGRGVLWNQQIPLANPPP